MMSSRGEIKIHEILSDAGFNFKEEYIFPDLLNEDLIGANVYGDGKLIGVLSSIIKNVNQELFVVKDGNKEYLIPNVSEFVKDINSSKKGIVWKQKTENLPF